jgi:hypothetical protein
MRFSVADGSAGFGGRPGFAFGYIRLRGRILHQK